jgi:hypothetical protein
MRPPPDSVAAREALTEAAADALRRHGLAAPAHLLIDAHRPYLPLIEDLAAFGGPLLRVLLGAKWTAVGGALTLRSVDRLLDRLVQPASKCSIPER